MKPVPRRLISLLVVCASALLVLQGRADAQKIHDGITADQLVAFAVGEGWSATRGAGNGVSIKFASQNIDVIMLDCDSSGRCGSGVIRRMSFQAIDGRNTALWHWNLDVKGATGFGPTYVSLQRYLHFRGVTDQYLREVIGKIWPAASESFWPMVEKNSRFRRDENK